MTSPAATDWRVPQHFVDATGAQVRDEFIDLIARDLLGPWGGEEEEFAPRAAGPRERYLVGMLGPRTLPGASPEIQPGQRDTETGADADGEPELPEVLSPQLGRMWVSSMGLSFALDPSITAVVVEASWGSYQRKESTDEDGATRRIWYREPIGHEVEVRTDTLGDHRVYLSGENGDQLGIWLTVQVRDHQRASGPVLRIVRVNLVNGQAEDVTPKDLAWMFQTRLTVTALDGGSAVFEPIGDISGGGPVPTDPEEQHLALLHRHQLRHAAGHNVAVHAERRPGERAAHRLTTTWLPTHDVPQVSAAGSADRPSGLVTSMDRLADLAETASVDELATALRPLTAGYRGWLDEQAKVDVPQALSQTAGHALARAEEALTRLRTGIELLATDPQARRAFAFANRAMALQRRNAQVAQLRERYPVFSHPEAFAQITELGDSAASWRPFQLAFVLVNLPALTAPGRTERTELVDLLFFPTGGGKTEAYLGLTAYTFALRRLQGVIGSGPDARDGRDGVAVLMRYTLRLLTAQQFQRAAALVCAAEVLRRADPATWGERPFSIGLWVGGSVTPNWFTEAAQTVAEARESGGRYQTRVLQTLRCPWCGAELAGHRDLATDDATREVLLYCPESEGLDACPFSKPLAWGRGLPILTVDEQVYRHPPSLLIATVDKLAQLPWFGFAGMLFGRVTSECPRHGYRHPDLDERIGCGERHNARSPHPAVKAVPVTPLRPPDLIIQDELHLISGALGTTVGLFESAVDELASWVLPDGTRTGPKIIASTATTKRAAEQVLGLYARDLAVFPPQVLDASDTFFSAEVPVDAEHPGRRYLGVCAHGVRLKSAEIRIAEILLLAGQTMFDTYDAPADAYMTLVCYFNATRELAGMRRFLEDDVAVRAAYNGSRRGIANRLTRWNQTLALTELTSRINSGDIAAVLKQVEQPFSSLQDTSARRIALHAAAAAANKAKQKFEPPPRSGAVDVLLATSMLQVGVDVSRLGLMLLVGQPKNTAEYIQASSRVGRDASRPGLVVTLYNWTRPRDLAHFEDFEPSHASFYRHVEALSVTPFSRRSLDRTTAATYLAAVRQARLDYSVNAGAHDVDLDTEPAHSITERLLRRSERAGGPRALEYFTERIRALRDRWNLARTGSSRLGYETRRVRGQQLVGLIQPAGQGPWDDLTVARSMRETENEINLLLPGSGMFDPISGPEWTYAPRPADEDGDDEGSLDGEPVGDDLGDPQPVGR